MGEETIFADESVNITTTRAVLGGVTYAMANITSVRTHVEPRPAIAILIGLIILVLGATCTSAIGLNSGGQIVGGTALVAAVCMFGIYFASKPKHWVRIGTAGGESNAVWSTNPAWTAHVVAAMNVAIVRRG